VPGSISDNGWNQAGYDGLTNAGKDLVFETVVSEKVKQPDQNETLSDYARRGYDLVIGHGGEFQDAVVRVAKIGAIDYFFRQLSRPGAAPVIPTLLNPDRVWD